MTWREAGMESTIIDPLKLRDEITAQISAHDYSKGALLLLAGPGTGKSFSLKITIKNQVARGVSLGDFYAMTLTNAAAGKFEAEVKEEVSNNFAGVSTVHFRAKGILHKYSDRVGLPKSFRILSEISKAERDEVLNDIQQDFASSGMPNGKKVIQKLFQKYQEAAANLQPCDDEFSERFVFYRHFYKAVEWYDVIALACRILHENSDIRAKESELSPFLLIDEYQDLNPADQELMRLLCNGRTTLLAVGDDDQSIYGGSLRYADCSGILNFNKLFPTAKKLVLPVCTRCPTNILKKAHALVSKNQYRDNSKQPLLALPKVDQRALGGLIESVGLKSDKAEAAFLATALRRLTDMGIPAKEVLVLCATRDLGLELFQAVQHQDSKLALEDCLTKAKSSLDAQQVLRYLLNFLENSEDNLALRMLFTALCELKPEEVRIIRQSAVENKVSLWSAIAHGLPTPHLRKSTAERIQRFASCVTQTQGEELSNRIKKFAAAYPSLEQVVAEWQTKRIAAEQTEDEARIEAESAVTGIRFMTMHSSKGLDAQYVFIPFMESDLVLAGKDMEEQRRLLYVAITRARTTVVFTWAWSRRSAARHKAGGGNTTGRQRHPFLSECGLVSDIQYGSVLQKLGDVAEHEKKWLAAHGMSIK